MELNLKKQSYIRIGDKFLYTDIVKAGDDYIRVGTQPQISKLLKKHNINPEYIVLLPPIITQAGDNYTGEEFVLWNKLRNNDLQPNTYIGYKKYVKYLHRRLEYTINQTFNKDRTKIIRKNRLKKIFSPVYLKPDSMYKLNNKVNIDCSISNVKIFYDNKLIYDWQQNNPSLDINKKIAALLKPYKKEKQPIKDALTIIPLGSGNGFNANTSNFIIQYANRTIWVDVMAEPFLALKKIKFHWDDITDYFISHVHEDHIEGLSAVLKRASIKNKQINLVTTKKILIQLKKIYSFLFPDFLSLVNHINIIPNSTLPYYHGYLTVRKTWHPLKCGALALKVRHNNNVFALSGDTYYSEELEKRFPENISFDSSWYNDCRLIFHEVEFFNKNTNHTFYTEIKKLSKRLNRKILGYHNSSEKSLLPMVREYKKYIIKNNKIFVK